ncbi:hypothetical protein FHH43_01395 [Clostridium perfringens]|nr:hypothetical protein [Clostridium perfringens]
MGRNIRKAIGLVIKKIDNDNFVVKVHRPSLGIFNTNILCKKEQSIRMNSVGIYEGNTVGVKIPEYSSAEGVITYKL